MVAHAALAVLAALAIVSGAGAAAAVGTGMIHLGNNGTFNLGTLIQGQNGTETINSKLYLNNTSHYNFELEKEDQIGSAFSTFHVYVTVNGTTYNLSSGNQNDTNILLTAGSHTFSIRLEYSVRSSADSINATQVPFLFLHATGNEQDLNESQSHNITSDIPAAGGNTDHQNSGGRYTLAYLTFLVNGKTSGQGEDNGSDNAIMRASV